MILFGDKFIIPRAWDTANFENLGIKLFPLYHFETIGRSVTCDLVDESMSSSKGAIVGISKISSSSGLDKD